MTKQEVWTQERGKAHFAQEARKKMGGLKYKNHPTKVDGIRFDSRKEADYYGQLKLRVKADLLTKFDVHKKYDLRVNGVLIGTYEADFVLYFPTGEERVVDVKSAATESLAVFRMKKALMFAIYRIIVHVEK